MHNNPQDMFDEMDEMFFRLFSRIDREFMDDFPVQSGYRIVVRDGGECPGVPAGAGGTGANPSPAAGEPVAEVHRIGDEVKVIASLPGITGDELRLDVRGSTLIIDAGDADHHYHTTADLPPVDTASMQETLKNGVLEVTFRSAAGTPA